MAVPTVLISEQAHALLRQLAEQTGRPPTEILDQALDTYRRTLFIEQLNAGYAALRADPAAWAEVEKERRSMAGSLTDGLDPEERWGDDGDLLPPAERKPNG